MSLAPALAKTLSAGSRRVCLEASRTYLTIDVKACQAAEAKDSKKNVEMVCHYFLLASGLSVPSIRIFTVIRPDSTVLVESEQSQQVHIVHQIRANKFAPALINSCRKILELSRPTLTWLVPARDRLFSERVNRRMVDIEVVHILGLFHHHLASTVSEQLVDHDPHIKCMILMSLEGLFIGIVDEWTRSW